jgi:hypothetical protein
MDEKEKFNGMHLMMIESMRKERERESLQRMGGVVYRRE